MQDIFQSDPLENDMLQELGLDQKYPLHIDIINNETGFALYMDAPGHRDFFDFYDFQGWPARVHHTNYDPDAPIVYTAAETSVWFNNVTYLRIRELDEEGNPGEWHRIPVNFDKFEENNPPEALEDLGFERFDTVTWLEGLEEDKQYQVQLWFDINQNGRIDTEAGYVRQIITSTHRDNATGIETVTQETDEWYTWQEAELYSGIHTINTDAEDFNLDIDSNGTMDFFIS